MMYTTTAKGLASLGRNGDDTLLHVNRGELEGLQALLGPVSTNPDTGLPEAYSWSSMLGSAVGGLTSFGSGAILEPIVSSAFDDVSNELIRDILSKAVPATVGAGIGAAVGGATGGKGGALGGAAQGFLSGGLGAMGSEDVLGKTPGFANQSPVTTQPPLDPLEALGSKTLPKTTPVGGGTISDAITPNEFKPTSSPSGPWSMDKVLSSTTPADAYQPSGSQGFMDKISDNMSRAYSNLSQPGKLKGLASDYGSYLFQAGLIGQGLADQTNAEDEAEKQREEYNRMLGLRNLRATQEVNQLFAGVPQYYASGGPVTMSAQGPIPVSITIPESAVDEARRAGGLDSLVSFAQGGYINTQPVNPDNFYPQSQIPKAQPYPAASPIRHEVVNNYAEGGYIDGEGDGMSDDIPADIEDQEEVRVADGEFVIPRHIVDMIGIDRLDELLEMVREASYGTPEQIEQDAGREAVEQYLGDYQ